MKLSFAKSKDGSTILTIYRDDGSKEWSKLRRGLEDHDIAHYVVEQNLGLSDAFYGMINQGVSISDFESKDSMPEIPDMAKSVEFVVNLLQTDKMNPINNDDFFKFLSQSLLDHKLPSFENLTATSLTQIKKEFTKYSEEVSNLATGQELFLELEI